MNNGLKNQYADIRECLTDIASSRGKSFFLKGNHLVALLRDLMPANKADINMIRRMADSGVLSSFVSADSRGQSEREKAIYSSIQVLVEEEFIDENKARAYVFTLAEAFQWTTCSSQSNSSSSASMLPKQQDTIYGNSIQTGWDNGKYIISYRFSDTPVEENVEQDVQLRISCLNTYLQQCEFSQVDLGENDQFSLITRTNYDENHNESIVLHSVKLLSGQLICTPASEDKHFLFRLDCVVAPGFVDHNALYIEWCDMHPDMQPRVFRTSAIAGSTVCIVLYHEKPGAAAKRHVVDVYKECIQKNYLNGRYIISYAFPDLDHSEIDENDERLRLHIINHYLRMFRFSKVEFGDDDKFALVTRTQRNHEDNSQSVSKSLQLIRGKLICTPSTKDAHYCFQLDYGISPKNQEHEDLYEGWCITNPDRQSRVFETSNIGDSKISRILFHAKPQ